MQVAIIHNHPIHYKHLLFQELKNRGLDFEVLFQASLSDIRHEKIPLAPDLYKSKTAYDGPYEAAPARVRAAFTWRSLSQTKPLVVVISGYYAIECWVALAWASLYRRKAVLWFESNEFDYPRSFLKETLKRIFLARCQAAHVYGRSSYQYLAKLGMSPERIVIKQAVADVDRFSTEASMKTYSPGRSKRLMYIGRLAPEKNVGMILRSLSLAMKSQPEIDLRLSIVGTGPLEQDLRKQCVELGIEQYVEFLGYCPQKDLPKMLRSADFFVLPSTREPWGLVALEAMLCRVPVLLSTQCGCTADVVTEQTGWKFSPWDEGELARHLLTLPGVPAERIATMGSAAYELAREYSPAECARRVFASIQSVTDGGATDAQRALQHV